MHHLIRHDTFVTDGAQPRTRGENKHEPITINNDWERHIRPRTQVSGKRTSKTDILNRRQEKASFFNVIAWRYTAEDSANILEKGVGVIVTGRLEQRSWEAEDGTKRSAIELVADTIGIQARSIESFERKRRSAEGGTPAKKATAPRTAVAQTITDNEEPF